jgi:hypothetical protein
MVAFMLLAPDRGKSVGAPLDYLGIESASQLRAMLWQPGAVLRQLFDPVNQHYWNLLLIRAAIAFVLSLAIWTFSDWMAMALVAIAMAGTWMIAGPVNGPPQFKVFYTSASAVDNQMADLASSTPGSMSTTRNLVLPAARREWIHEFPNPFV